MSINSSVSAAALRQFIEKVEHIEDEKSELQGQIKRVLEEAKAQKFDTKIIRQIVRMRKMKKAELAEQQELLDIYLKALGMQIAV